MGYEAAYRTWRERTTADGDLGEELASIEGQPSAIEDRFYRELTFGTGGLRGVIGAGPNRMNVYIVGKATQGVCDYLKGCRPERGREPSVAIAYDSRNKSLLFAKTAASVFAANGVQVYLYARLMPTPALSFAVRKLGCDGGVVITASHNPARYNGYKVYDQDGCQITDEAAASIQARIGEVHVFDGVASLPFEDELAAGRIRYIGQEVASAYLDAVSSQSLLEATVDRDFSIVYTPLHGAGISCVPECLRRNGFTHIAIPHPQSVPDGAFPTCPDPNPENREALKAGLACAAETQSDLVLATDPDCDRVGVAVRDGAGYTQLNGNQVGVLLFDFICMTRAKSGRMPQRPFAVKTIVTTPLAEKVAAQYGVELIDVLTGFKYIGERIGLLEKRGEADRYLFGFEESYGYLSGTFVRDKDAVNASLLICEMFAAYRAKGMTLVQALEGLYRTHGFFCEKLASYTFEGVRGFQAMERVMRSLRSAPPTEISGVPVTRVTDYQNHGITGLRPSNVVKLHLPNGSVVIRPSGTEPKLKLYCFAQGKTRQESEALLEGLTCHFDAWLHSIRKGL